MPRPRLILLGGFLGSGKTTLMIALAKRLRAAGKAVGVVTNDQGDLLVDTEFADAEGLAAGEVQNGCFCCNFTSFVENLDEIANRVEPDYIIAEPVGSCTDLVPTVLTPLALYHQGIVDLGAYFVLADAPRLAGEYQELSLRAPITPREVLLAHQIAEAGHLILSKTDAISAERLKEARAYLRGVNASAAILECSARTGGGIDSIAEVVLRNEPVELPKSVEIDYEVYAAAEAEMGWYNGHIELAAASADSLDPEALVLDLAMAISGEVGGDLIHGKLVITTDSGSIKVSVVSGVIQADVAREGNNPAARAGLTINLRATVEPDALVETVTKVVDHSVRGIAEVQSRKERSLIPGEPVPEHRISSPTER